MKKRILLSLLALLLTAALVSCNANEGAPGTSATGTSASDTSATGTAAPDTTGTGTIKGTTAAGTGSPDTTTGGTDTAGTTSRTTTATTTSPDKTTTEKSTTPATTVKENPPTTTDKGDTPEKAAMLGYLKALFAGYKLNPASYIPETLRPGAAAYTATQAELSAAYGEGVSVSEIRSRGMGEQWKMVTDNLAQSSLFFNALDVVEGLASSSVTAFEAYLDQNPAETAQYSFISGVYTVTIHCDTERISYVLDYKIAGVNAQIAMQMDLQSGEKAVRIQLSDANALRYTITDNAYTFAIRYAGVRRAYFTIRRDDDGTVTGHINEFLGAANIWTQSAADFCITQGYLSVVGNKASGLVGFTGIICELYNAKTGQMLGYEVKEEQSKLGVTFNTLWLDLKDLAGLTSLRYTEATEEEAAAFYCNGSDKAFKSKLVGGISKKMASRRFDLEFRTQYFYVCAADGESYETVAVQVPMLFVQAEQLDSLVKDMKSTNGIDLAVTLAQADLARLQNEYASRIPAFEARKDTIKQETILAYIGSAFTFEE